MRPEQKAANDHPPAQQQTLAERAANEIQAAIYKRDYDGLIAEIILRETNLQALVECAELLREMANLADSTNVVSTKELDESVVRAQQALKRLEGE